MQPNRRNPHWIEALAVLAVLVLGGAPGCSSCVAVDGPPGAQDAGPDGGTDLSVGEAGLGEDTAVDASGGRDTPERDSDRPDSSSLDTEADASQRDAPSDDTGPGDTSTDTGTETGPDVGDAADAGAVCGDGVVEGSEACDDGNTSSGDYCASDCQTVTGRCGDGVLQSNESCDDGQITSNCDTYHDGGDGSCQPPGQCSSGYTYDGSKCVPKKKQDHVHIYITNRCKLSVQPKSLTMTNGRSVQMTYHNHSSSYSADVIYAGGGGGFYDLKPGKSWTPPISRCTNQNRPYTITIEITVHGFPVNDPSCPGHKFKIYCK